MKQENKFVLLTAAIFIIGVLLTGCGGDHLPPAYDARFFVKQDSLLCDEEMEMCYQTKAEMNFVTDIDISNVERIWEIKFERWKLSQKRAEVAAQSKRRWQQAND